MQTRWRSGAIMWRWKWILIPLVALPIVAAGFLSTRQEAQYQGKAQVLIDDNNLATGLAGLPAQPSNSGDQLRELQTEATVARSIRVAQLLANSRPQGDVTPDQALAASSVSADRNADILSFAYTDPNPARAVDLANAYAGAYTQFREDLDARAIKAAKRDVDARLAQLDRRGNDEGLRRTLESKREQLETLSVVQTPHAAVVNPAQGATKTAPRTKRNLALGLLVGLVLGYVAMVVLEAARPRRLVVAEQPEALPARELV